MAAYGDLAAHSTYDIFSKCKYLTVNLAFSPLRFLE